MLIKKPFLVFLALLVSFIIHRFFIIDSLGITQVVSYISKFYAIASGICSDIWGAVILLPFFVFLPRKLLGIAFIAFNFFLACHIAYVNFFHVTLRAVHLNFLYDRFFIQSAINEIFNGLSLMQFFLGIAIALFIFYKKPLIKTTYKTQIITFTTIIIIGLFANYGSRKFQRKKDLSINLVINPLVGVILDIYREINLNKSLNLSSSDINKLQEYIPASNNNNNNNICTNILSPQCLSLIVTNSSTKAPDWRANVENMLAEQFSPNILQKEKRFFFIFLLESARKVESSLFYPNIKGVMPKLDELVSNGIVFPNSYSTSVVSRAGAESVACNSFPSEMYNAMRDTPTAQPKCAQEIFEPYFRQNNIASTFYYLSGGFVTYDNLASFWTRHHFTLPFRPESEPYAVMTSWGMSDKSLFSITNKTLSPRVLQPGLDFATIATITNHTNYDLPTDASPEVKAFTKGERILHTSKYADESIFEFVNKLKQNGIWNRSVVLIMGDHGVRAGSLPFPGWHSFGKNKDGETAISLSDIYFAMSGGLVELTLQKCREQKICPLQKPLHIQDAVSQIDALPTLANLLGVYEKNNYVGIPLLHTTRKWPLFADLSEVIYMPQNNIKTINRDNFFRDVNNANTSTASLWYKAYINIVRQNHLSTIGDK